MILRNYEMLQDFGKIGIHVDTFLTYFGKVLNTVSDIHTFHALTYCLIFKKTFETMAQQFSNF